MHVELPSRLLASEGMAVVYLTMRLEIWDLFAVWFSAFAIFSVFTYNLKYSLIVSVFALVNFFVVYYWFAVDDGSNNTVNQFLAQVTIGAHRGAAEDYPENTMAAFKESILKGVPAIELDLEFTSDGVPVVLHDDTVERTTNGAGYIKDMTWEEAKKLNASYRFKGRNSEKFHNESIPHFEDVIKLCIQHNVKIFIDVKATNKHVVPLLVETFAKHKELYRLAAVCSFYPQVVYEVKSADNRIITGHTWREGFFQYEDADLRRPRFRHIWKNYAAMALDTLNEWFLHRWLWKFSGASLILTCRNSISPNYLSQWRQRGLHVVAWTVNAHYEKLHYLHTLKCPFLTDGLSDVEGELKQARRACVAQGSEDSTTSSSCSPELML